MGGWKLEVARMAMYVTFPVGLFYYFNQPQLFEEYVTKKKREMYPPDNYPMTVRLKNAMKEIQVQREEQELKALEDEVAKL